MRDRAEPREPKQTASTRCARVASRRTSDKAPRILHEGNAITRSCNNGPRNTLAQHGRVTILQVPGQGLAAPAAAFPRARQQHLRNVDDSNQHNQTRRRKRALTCAVATIIADTSRKGQSLRRLRSQPQQPHQGLLGPRWRYPAVRALARDHRSSQPWTD